MLSRRLRTDDRWASAPHTSAMATATHCSKTRVCIRSTVFGNVDMEEQKEYVGESMVALVAQKIKSCQGRKRTA